MLQGLILSLLNLFAGFFIPESEMPTPWVWMYWANPLAHAWRAMVPVVFRCSGSNEGCNVIDVLGTPTRVEDYVFALNGYKYDDRWLYVLTLLGFTVAYRLVAMLALRYLNFLKR